MGHEDGSVQARYSHVTAEMRRRLLVDLTEVWEEALEVRRRLCPGSPVQGSIISSGANDQRFRKIVSQDSPEEIH